MSKGQTIVEYLLMLGIVIVVLYAMGPTYKRAVQSMIKSTADSVAIQKNGDQDFSPLASHMDSSITVADIKHERDVNGQGAVINTIYNDRDGTFTNTISNLGFSP